MIIGTAGHIDHGKTTLVRALTGVDTDRLKEEKARGISIELGYAYMPVPPLQPPHAPQPAADAASATAQVAGASGQGARPADTPDTDTAGDTTHVLGIIDVPGHEKFVHTMAAGASGIDHALLVVAADDGVMPQTREHLAIALLFGITQGTVALTKCDRADAERIAAVKAEVAALLAGTPLAGAPVFETAIRPAAAPPAAHAPEGAVPAAQASEGSAPAAQGIAALREHLFTLARQQHARRRDGLFRLAVDRVFTLAGHGTVVTGTVFGGHVLVGDTIAHSATGQAVRVRSLHAQNRAAQQGRAGQRVALNLTGVDKQAIARGDWIADARVLQPSTRIDVRLRLLDDAPPLTAWTPLHVHLGAAHRQAHAVPLQGDTVAPGTEARVQLVFDPGAPVFVVPGDRLILRNAQGTRTVGGGAVLDPQAPERRRRSAERMQWLDALETLIGRAGGEAPGDARPLLAVAPAGLTRSGLARLLGRLPAPDWAGPDAPAFPLGQAGPLAGAALGAPGAGESDKASQASQAGRADILWLSPAAWAQVQARILDALARHHARAPDEPGLNSARLQRMAFPAQSALAGFGTAMPGWPAWLDKLAADGVLARSGQWLHLPGHSVTLSDAEQALADRLLPLLLAGGNDPPWVRDLAQATGTREDAVRDLLRKQARLGALYQVVKDLFYPAQRMAELAATFATLSAQATHAADSLPLPPRERAGQRGRQAPAPRLPRGAVEARVFRDAVQLGRKRAIQILECFDRIGYTRRVGDAHLLRPHTRWTPEGPITGPAADPAAAPAPAPAQP